MVKVVLTAGGKGTRVHELTGSVIPKSLCRISSAVNKPLVSYQLSQIKKAGLEDVLVTMETDWQVQLFKQSVSIGEIPKLNYVFGLTNWRHPMTSFQEKVVLDFVGNDDCIWTYGDVFYSPDLLEKLRLVSTTNGTSVACQMFSNGKRWSHEGKYLTFSQDQRGKIINYEWGSDQNFTIHAPFYFRNTDYGIIEGELKNHEPRTLSLLLRLADRGSLSVVEPDFLLNMNVPEDIRTMEDAILKYLP